MSCIELPALRILRLGVGVRVLDREMLGSCRGALRVLCQINEGVNVYTVENLSLSACVAAPDVTRQFLDLRLGGEWRSHDLANNKQRPLLDLHIDPTEIFPNYPKRE
jgi:hypothetical protein